MYEEILYNNLHLLALVASVAIVSRGMTRVQIVSNQSITANNNQDVDFT